MLQSVLNPIATKVYQCWPSGYYTVKTGNLKEWKDRFLEVKGSLNSENMDYTLRQNPQWYRNINPPLVSVQDLDTYIPPPIPSDMKSQVVVTFGDNAWPLSAENEPSKQEKISQFQSWYEQSIQRSVHMASKAHADQDTRHSVFLILGVVVCGAAILLGLMILSKWFI